MRRTLPLLTGLLIAWPAATLAIQCPRPVEQVSGDWQIEVDGALAKIARLSGLELKAQVSTTTRDLLSRMPEAAKVYLDHMMFSAYCTALRDDKTISEAEKAKALKQYILDVYGVVQAERQRTIYQRRPKGTPSPTTPLPESALQQELRRYAGYLEGRADIVHRLLVQANRLDNAQRFIQLHEKRLQAIRAGRLVEADRLAVDIQNELMLVLPDRPTDYFGQYYSTADDLLTREYADAVPIDEPLVDFLARNITAREAQEQ